MHFLKYMDIYLT